MAPLSTLPRYLAWSIRAVLALVTVGPLVHLGRVVTDAGGEPVATFAQSADWHADGLDVRVAVNLSAANLLHSELPGTVAAILDEYELSPHLLQLEITEDTLMVDPEGSVEVIRQIRAQGIEFALDDSARDTRRWPT